MLIPVVMAGGSGTRLWPLSRQLRPKQFQNLVGKQTMLQATLARLEGLDKSAPTVICNEEHRFLVAEQLREQGVQGATILLEPVGKNTAPAIALAALSAASATPDVNQDPVLLVLAADHHIADVPVFVQSVKVAYKLAEQGKLVTFGVVPTEPHTGYGYILRGEQLAAGGFAVSEFVEKPDLTLAQQYLESGDYYWNSGCFMFKASRYLQALEQFRPDILAACKQSMELAHGDLDFVRVDKEAFEACASESIDYAVMEKAADVAVVPLDVGWSDIGSWSSLWEIGEKDASGNVCTGDVITESTTDCLIHSEHKLVAAIGLENLVIVETKDALLVADKNSVQDVKKIVEKIKADGRHEHFNHREVYRPWGKYDSIDVGERYQVKRITVNPGQRASLQMHYHRSEHWVVVKGVAKVRIGEKKMLVTENQSVYIPVGEKHSIENPGKTPLEFIEVQSGSYLGEDDIVRFEDGYGRT